jgi:simple sugar transport system ATP-binding protein
MAHGIGMVHQHFMLVPNLTVAENVVLGREPTRRGLLDLDAACEQVAATCRRFGFQLPPRARVDSLSVGSQQKVEIVRALHRDARTLILDEPTAVLTPQEAAGLYDIARALAAEGRTVVFITHKLREVMEVATRIAVMRRGRKVLEVAPGETSAVALAEAMVGKASAPSPSASAAVAQVPRTPAGPEVLRLEDVDLERDGRARLRKVALTVRAGEIVGIAGVDGNGQSELAEVVTGLTAPTSGRMVLGGAVVSHFEPGALREAGVAHVPEDRLRRAVVKAMSVEENLALGRQRTRPFARRGLIDFAGRRERAASLIRAYDVRPTDPSLPMGALSGGNQQKAVLARELDRAPKLLVAVQPTRGLDVQAVATLHTRLRQAAAEGAGVLLVSLDLDEVLALSDRAYVLYGGAVVGERSREALEPMELGRLMMGAGHA